MGVINANDAAASSAVESFAFITPIVSFIISQVMESHRHNLKRKWVLAGGAAALLIGTVMAGLRVAPAAATSAKNPGALAEKQSLDRFHNVVSPILESRCYDCHGDGKHKADIAFDGLTKHGPDPA